VIVDSSALIAILRREPESIALMQALEAAPDRRISAANLLEAAIVADNRREPKLGRRLDQFVQEWSLTIEPITEEQARIARDAYRDFGRGSGHPAQLNFGDCFAYALAKAKAEPLLFKGDDFRHTDVRPAITRT
jgi:ribonuclease VapC